MKKLLMCLILLLGSINFSLAQTYSWATTDTSYHSDYGARTALAKDQFGNLFVAYASLVDIGYASFIAIIKYDASHNIIWTQKIASSNIGGPGVGLCTDALGNVYVTSNFVGNLYFNSTVCASASGGNMFLIKMNSSGVFQWVKNSTGSSAFGSVLSSDAQNNIYVGGNINGDVYFDTNFVSTTVVYNYIAKYNSSGSLLWIKHPTGGSFAGFANIGMATDASGSTYLAGTFDAWANFGGISLTAFGGSSDEDVYITKIDKSGNWVWAINAGGISQDAIYGRGLALDNNGGLYVTGFIESATATFGSITLTNTSPGSDDYFLAKYDTLGTSQWALNGGGSSDQFGINVCSDSYGNSYINTSNDFISKYDNTGHYLWSQYKSATNIAMLSDVAGSIYISGYFQNTVNFDSFTLNAADPYTKQMYVAKLGGTTTSINEMKYTDDFSVYPNPAGKVITVTYNNLEKAGDFILRINNSSGKSIYAENVKIASGSFSKNIDLSSFPKGIYFVEMQPASFASKANKRNVTKIVLQ